MIPFELISFLGSAVIGGIMKIASMKSKAKAQTELATLQALNAKAKITKEAREYANEGFQITRRIIALAATFSIIVLPILASVIYPFWFPFEIDGGIPITFGYTEAIGGFWPFTEPKDITKWTTVQSGILITPFHTHLMSAITGMYFGTKN